MIQMMFSMKFIQLQLGKGFDHLTFKQSFFYFPQFRTKFIFLKHLTNFSLRQRFIFRYSFHLYQSCFLSTVLIQQDQLLQPNSDNNQLSMRNNPLSLDHPSKLQDKININRKESFFKQSHANSKLHGFELPRFYSSEHKGSKKNLPLHKDQQSNPIDPPIVKPSTILRKKQSTKYSKTEKNETPTKIQPQSLKKMRAIYQKKQDLIHRGKDSRPDFGRATNIKKYIDYEDVPPIQSQYKSQKREEKAPTNSNTNKIRYKKTGQKRVIIDMIETEGAIPQKQPKSHRQSKVMTEEAHKPVLRETKTRILLKNEELFNEYLKETQNYTTLNQTKTRTFSSFEQPVRQICKLNIEEIDHLYNVLDIIKKIIKNPNNLDHPELFIVTDKVKFQKKYYSSIDQKNKKHYKQFIALLHLSFYLCAHYILLGLNAKNLLSIFTKLSQSQSSLINMLGVIEQKRLDKFFSQNKVSSKELSLKKPREDPMLMVENRGHIIQRNNEVVRKIFEGIFVKKTLPFHELFQSLLVSSMQIESFEFIGFLDKTLKWQILKMPTSPFLPPAQSHKHYLILDLDETLIHFDPNQQTFLVRPYAEQFLKKLSLHYEITIFTAATKEYADEIINQIDKTNCITHRLYRNHLTFLEGQSIKDISLLGRDLKTSIIVDNLETNFRLHPQNGILIKSWYGGYNDTALHKLETLLFKVAFEYPQDLRKGLKFYQNFIEQEISETKKGYKVKYQI